MTTPKIIIGEHTITIEKSGEVKTPSLLDLEEINNAAVKTAATITAPSPTADEYYTGGSIKAMEEDGEIAGYLVVWGDENQRDKQGEYFTPQTEFRLDYYKERPVLYHHGLGEADSIKIGEIYEMNKDEIGIFARARLSLKDPIPDVKKFANQAWEKTKANKLFWSSGSIGHLIDITPNGKIIKWPLVEGSLTPTPAEPVRTKVDAIKAAFQQLEDEATPKPTEPMAIEATDAKTLPIEVRQKSKTRYSKGLKMDISMVDSLREQGFDDTQILAIITTFDAQSANTPEIELEPEPDAIMAADAEEEMDDEDEDEPVRSATAKSGKGSAKQFNSLLKEIKQLKTVIQTIKTAPPTENVNGASGATKGNRAPVLTRRSKWDNLDWRDMVFVKQILEGANRGKWQPDQPEDFARAFKAKIESEKDINWSPGAIKAMNAIKADEVNYSTLASYGDEFVPDLWRGQLWEKPRLDNPVFREMQVIEMPSDPYNLPIESTDPTIFSVSETADENQLGQNDSNAAIPDTQVGTTNTTLASGKLAARINISSELVEDSIIPIAQHWRFKAVRAMEDARDYVILGADATTGTSNINYDGSSISATHRALYGGGDGLLHLPLVTATTLGVDQGNANPTLAKIRQARMKLNSEILADFGNLVYFCDPIASVKLASMDEFVDASINGRESSVLSGFIGQIDGIPVYVTAQMSQATATGVVSGTAASNTRGRLLLVHVPSWYVGFRRNVSVNLAFEPAYDAWTLVVSMRMALARRAADVASLLYNIAS